MKNKFPGRKSIYKGRIVDLGMETATLPNGQTLDLEIVRHQGGSATIAVNAKNEIVLIRQYRHCADSEIYEIPAGVIEIGEEPIACAKRELLEEAQYTSVNFIKLGEVLSTPGFCDERLHLYAALDIQAGEGLPDNDEFISEVVLLPITEALQWIASGKIIDAKTICAISMYNLWKENNPAINIKSTY